MTQNEAETPIHQWVQFKVTPTHSALAQNLGLTDNTPLQPFNGLFSVLARDNQSMSFIHLCSPWVTKQMWFFWDIR
jgi:hypothetical protein